MIRILAIGLEISDAASYYRICPLFHLEKKMNLEIKIQISASFVDVMNSDIVYLTRGYTEDHVRIAKLAKSLGKKLWVDFDDDVLNIQIDHAAFFVYRDPETAVRLKALQDLAHLISVSNDPLLDVYPGSSLIENALDERYFEWRTPSAKPINKIVSWRGSSSHIKNLAAFSPAILRVMEDHLDWKFHFAGDKPWQIIDGCKKSQPQYLKDWFDTHSWMRYLHDLKPTINIVLLEDSPLNRGRSHTSWLENTMAGAVTLAPDWPDWCRPCVNNYKNIEDFESNLRSWISHLDSKGDVFDRVERAWQFILENFTLKQINLKREAAICNLLS